MFKIEFCLNIIPPHWKLQPTNIVFHALMKKHEAFSVTGQFYFLTVVNYDVKLVS